MTHLRRAIVALAWSVALTFTVSDAFWAGAFDWWDSAPRVAFAVIGATAASSLALWGDQRGSRAAWLAGAAMTPLVYAYAGLAFSGAVWGQSWPPTYLDPLTEFVMYRWEPDGHVLALAPAAVAMGGALTFVPRSVWRAAAWVALLTCALTCGHAVIRTALLPAPAAYLASLDSHDLVPLGQPMPRNIPNPQVREVKLVGCRTACDPEPTVPAIEQTFATRTSPPVMGKRTCFALPAFDGRPARARCSMAVASTVVVWWYPPEPEPAVSVRIDPRLPVTYLFVDGAEAAATNREGEIRAYDEALGWQELGPYLAPPVLSVLLAVAGVVSAAGALRGRRDEASLALALLTMAPLWPGLWLLLR